MVPAIGKSGLICPTILPHHDVETVLSAAVGAKERRL
jgi:hypothetical protein